MRILITGIGGFVGGHLAERLLARSEVEVHGIGRHPELPDDLIHLRPRLQYHTADLLDTTQVAELLRHIQPERIVHLAGYADAGRSFQEPEAAWQGNVEATRRLYQAVLSWGGQPRILYVGSGLIYGDSAHDGVDLTEDSALLPSTPYAAGKAAADLLSYQYSRWPGLWIVRARPFNHFGPRQSSAYAIPNFARQVAAIATGWQPPLLETGNLSSQRDLTDVRDVVRSYELLLEQGEPGGAYNIASGAPHAMKNIVDRLLALAGVDAEVRQDARLVRAQDTAVVRVSTTRLRAQTGWQPEFDLDRSLLDTLNYWRARLQTPRAA